MPSKLNCLDDTDANTYQIKMMQFGRLFILYRGKFFCAAFAQEILCSTDFIYSKEMT